MPIKRRRQLSAFTPTVIVAKPLIGGKRSPNFVPRAGITGDTLPGACKKGCYGKYFFKKGKPMMLVCRGGKPAESFQVKSAADAVKKLGTTCSRGSYKRRPLGDGPSPLYRGYGKRRR